MKGFVGSTFGCLVGGAAAATEVMLNTTTIATKSVMGVRKPLDLGERDDVNFCSSFGGCDPLGGDDVESSRRRQCRMEERGSSCLSPFVKFA
jgi:hypothetical protein